jgi:hypothetical protein
MPSPISANPTYVEGYAAKGRWLGLWVRQAHHPEPVEGPRRRGFRCHCSPAGKSCLGSAENPSVSLREPPSLGKGRSYLPLTSRPSDDDQDMRRRRRTGSYIVTSRLSDWCIRICFLRRCGRAAPSTTSTSSGQASSGQARRGGAYTLKA